MMNDEIANAEKDIYIRQLEEEIFRLKCSNKSLRKNNKGLLQGFNKIQKQLRWYKIEYKKLKEKE